MYLYIEWISSNLFVSELYYPFYALFLFEESYIKFGFVKCGPFEKRETLEIHTLFFDWLYALRFLFLINLLNYGGIS